MTAVIYARYSSDNQREESIEGQIRECTAFAEKNDITGGIGGGLFGFIGMLLGVPVCAVIYDETRRAIRKRETADTSQKG